ncbi:hypothetical protein [Pseudomonas sp. HY7a-MNA-CIBAN-0227]|uniref:hypothetical protein n=1 Tax=Pseudomonas sp. HY7a-MNA-CIBAN-0227 TaxID=3140474 RepID=UPI003330E049
MTLQAITHFRSFTAVYLNAKSHGTTRNEHAFEFPETCKVERETNCAMKVPDGFTIKVKDLIYVGFNDRIGRLYEFKALSGVLGLPERMGCIAITDRGAVTITDQSAIKGLKKSFGAPGI